VEIGQRGEKNTSRGKRKHFADSPYNLLMSCWLLGKRKKRNFAKEKGKAAEPAAVFPSSPIVRRKKNRSFAWRKEKKRGGGDTHSFLSLCRACRKQCQRGEKRVEGGGRRLRLSLFSKSFDVIKSEEKL